MNNQEIPARHTDHEKREILQKAIRKAIANGYQTGAFDDDALASVVIYYSTDSHWYEMIYDHQFAKSLWGEEGSGKFSIRLFADNGHQDHGQEVPAWKFHLQQMVIADDPIKYLGETL